MPKSARHNTGMAQCHITYQAVPHQAMPHHTVASLRRIAKEKTDNTTDRSHVNSHTHTHPHTHTHTQTHTHTHKNTHTHTQKHTHTHTPTHTHKQTDRQTDRQIDRQRHTDTQGVGWSESLDLHAQKRSQIHLITLRLSRCVGGSAGSW